MKMLQKQMPVLHEPWFPVDISEHCFTQLYPKEQLVYLTPHCCNDLEKWDHDAHGNTENQLAINLGIFGKLGGTGRLVVFEIIGGLTSPNSYVTIRGN
jgi:hypothetical protein